MKRTLSALLALLSVGVLPAQRPRSADEALAKLSKVEQQEERLRHGAVRDLGRFAEASVTAALLRELERASTVSYRQTVVRALGDQRRDGVIEPLLDALREAANPRLCDSAAAALAAQGDPGVEALASELPPSPPKSIQRNAICYALGRLTHPVAKAALLRDLQAQQGRDRLPALRGLAAFAGDDEVDEARRGLAGDADDLVAATALTQLAEHRGREAPALAASLAARLKPDAEADRWTAVLRGLLVAPSVESFDALLAAASRADDPFGEACAADWQRAFDVSGFAAWLADKAAAKKDPLERVAAARAAALAPAEHADATLIALQKLLGQREAEVVQAAATAMAARGGAAAELALQQLLDKANGDGAAAALGALDSLRHDQPAWLEQLRQLAGHKRPAVRTAALRALAGSSGAADAVDVAGANLTSRDWPVRAAAIELLVRGRSAKAPPLLFERLDKEQARLRQDLVDGLASLTGLRFATVAEWRSWWQKEGAAFQPIASPRPADGKGRPRGDAAGTAAYWDIPVTSDRVAFVVDVSGSMTTPFGTGDATRLDEARRQLGRVFDALPAKCKLNVIAFAFDGKPLFPTLTSLDKGKRKQADAFVQQLSARGPTNVHDALRVAFADPDVDTIFLLTDGRPSTGAIVAPGRLADEVQRWNLGRGVRIHTIAIGEKSDFLERLANDSGGEHTVAR
ncbi:MAG: VWA domain-containing protein [Planctomycetes bacterium]|nr:VWA domain-containing protein [Planctomycetota bacterium]